MVKEYIGIDVSKHHLDVDWLGEPIQFFNNENGVAELSERLSILLKQDKLALVLCEASGGYEQKLMRVCHQHNIPVHRAHANHVKYFARSQGIKAKTDCMDAKLISAYGKERRPAPEKFILNQNAEKIRDLLKRREQLVSDRKREQSRLDKIESVEIKLLIESHIDWLNQSIKGVESTL